MMEEKHHGNDHPAGNPRQPNQGKSPSYESGVEAGRQGSPQMSLLRNEGFQPSGSVKDGEVHAIGEVKEACHTYENVQSVREKAGLPLAAPRKQPSETKGRSSVEERRKKLNSPVASQDIPMTPMKRGSTGIHDLITPDDSPCPRRHKTTDPNAMIESTGTLNSCGSNTYTMTGTLRRGKKREQSIDVELQLTQTELDRLNQSTVWDEEEKGKSQCRCGRRDGPHVLLLSVLFIPCALVSSMVMSFYIGTMCWYNIYLCFNEDKTLWHKVFLCPLLIIFYPLLIVLVTVGLAIFAAFVQISWSFKRWLKQIRDFEKGFFGWFCEKVDLPECSPYEVIVLQEGTISPVMGTSSI